MGRAIRYRHLNRHRADIRAMQQGIDLAGFVEADTMLMDVGRSFTAIPLKTIWHLACLMSP